MADLFWKPQEESVREGWGVAQESRIGRFLGLSGVLHIILAAISPWLLVSFSLTPQEEQLIIRTVDFVLPPETAPVASRSEAKGGGGAPPVALRKASEPARRPPAREPAPRPVADKPPALDEAPHPKAADIPEPRAIASAVSPSAARRPASVEPAPAPQLTPSAPTVESAKALAESLAKTGDLPTLPEAVTRAPAPVAAEPRAVGGAGGQPVASRPSPVAGSSRQIASEKDGGGQSANQAVGLARELQAGPGGGLVATVAIPPGLVQGAGQGGSGNGTGARVGAGSGPGAGPGGGLVDTRDPDFSEYFRMIERRVRSAWRFPDGLQGTTQTVKIAFSLRLDGALQEVRVVSSTSGALNEGALTAMRRAAPFPPLPAKFRALLGQPLVMSFTVTIK